MKKIGRNEPCHCGSGKKYKNCCLKKDEEKEYKENLKYYGDSKDEFIDNYIIEDEISFKQIFNDEFNNETDYPEITLQENEAVEKWWNKYEKMEDPIKIKAHLDDFLANNSKNAVINLGLEDEVLFELIAEYFKLDKADEIINFLIEFREEYQEVYIKNYAYYDFDIISWLILNNRNDEICKYLNYFEQYPIDHIDKLFELIDLLNSTNNSEYILPVVRSVYKKVCNSDEVIGGYDIIDDIIIDIYAKYIKENNTDKEYEKLLNEIKKLDLDFHETFISVKFWKERIENTLKSYSPWETIPLSKKPMFDKQIFNIVSNFSRFLHEEKQLTYITSHYYAKKIYEFYHKYREFSNFKNIFNFEKDIIDETVSYFSNDFYFTNFLRLFIYMNALFYFAEYLEKCGNYNHSQKENLQNVIKELLSSILDDTFREDILIYKIFQNQPIFL